MLCVGSEFPIHCTDKQLFVLQTRLRSPQPAPSACNSTSRLFMGSLPETVQPFMFSADQPGFRVDLPDNTSAAVLQQGAHVLSWQPAGHRPVLWLSNSTWRQSDKPIRGGIPVCFPWFGPHPTDNSQPAHGLARIRSWHLANAASVGNSDEIELHLTCQQAPFTVDFRVRIGRELKCTLAVHLPADATSPASFEAALHTYLAVSDIRSVQVLGLESVPFLNRAPGETDGKAANSPITFSAETDRIYQHTEHTVQVVDRGWNRVISISKAGSKSTVVWNPWIDKSHRMPDFGDNEWTGMLCVETANIGECAIQLQPGQSHTLHALLAVRHQ